ncbi:hypothetical protein [Mesorhizobium australafricanum]|uniref:Uncharacterized protein n=1 Tax=Mesorhizobium australafricanum TaxID=3072311 RepID=A0ABU4WZ85_9HYPH|nr:hypothetical protein [Mesorhizobium sp. VK3E]MDX8441360.1 hypothetical protein [Mesorhizobium sp. VK3E]
MSGFELPNQLLITAEGSGPFSTALIIQIAEPSPHSALFVNHCPTFKSGATPGIA